MTSRERVIRSIRFEHPDRVPVLHRIKPGYFRLHGEAIRALQERYPPDILQSPTTHTWFTFHSPGKLSTQAGALVRDEWGCVWKNLSSDYLGQVVDSPLKSWSDLAAYRFPDPAYVSEGLEEMDEVRRADGGKHYLLAWVGSLFHLYTYLRGYEQALIDVAEESTGYFQLLDRIIEFLVARIRLLGRRGVDGILISDDWGTQLDVLINPETCILCGHCKAVCPEDAVEIPATDSTECVAVPDKSEFLAPEKLMSLFRYRRSTRIYKDLPVEKEKIKSIIEAGRVAPTAA